MNFGGGPEALGPLLILAIILFAGNLGGMAARRFGAPALTGNIVVGVFLALTLFREVNVAERLQPVSTFAIGLIAVTAGGHFSYRRLHNSMRRVLFVAVLEVLFAVVCVGSTVYFLGSDVAWPVALMLGCLSASTAPATTIALIRESRAKGPFVKTLLASVVVDSSLCILLFAFAHSLMKAYFSHGEMGIGFRSGLFGLLWEMLSAGLLGVALGIVVSRLFAHERFHDFSTLFLSLLAAIGLSFYLNVSPLLTCLFMGVYLGNSSTRNELQLNALEPIEPLLYTAFFTLAGVGVHMEHMRAVGFLAVAYVVARAVGKGVGAWAGARLAGCSPRIVRSIPFGFVPQAGVALGLVVILEGDPGVPEDISAFIGTLVLAAVTINEIIGPFFTRFALKRAKETGLDRPRLVEFLQEEFILPNLEATDKWDALDKLVEFYAMTHRIGNDEKEMIRETVLEREREHSTAIGLGAALPHGRVPEGLAIQGVMGIAPQGIGFDAPDGRPVKLVVLIVTPEEHEERHLQTLASLSEMVSDWKVRNRLMAAEDANEAWEILEVEESRGFNYFLEGGENGESRKAETA